MHGVAALESVRVVELGSGIASAIAGMTFGDYGADVLLVEPPLGDRTRAEAGAAVWHRNKSSLVIDQDDPDDRHRLATLLGLADVCIRGGGDHLGELDAVLDAACSANPRLVALNLAPYSPCTPWFGNEESNELVSAVTGLALRHSSVQDVPVDPVYPHVPYLQGVWGATCAVAALVERTSSGRGQVVTVDTLQASLIAGSVTSVVNPVEATRPVVPAGAGGPSPCYTRYVCSDGQWLFLGALSPKFQLRALELLGLTDMLADPRLGGQLDRMLAPDNNRWVRAQMAERFRTRPQAEWLSLLDAADCPAGPLLPREQWLDHEQVRAIGMRVEIKDPARGDVVMPGVPMGMSATPGSVRRPAPGIGERTLDDLGWTPRTHPVAGSAAAEPATGRGPLAGVRVLNLGTVLAGPFAGVLLSDLGADVVKVEPPDGDTFRVRGFAFNRGSRSLAVDLRNDRGRAAFYELVRSADVVIDNYRPGVLQRLRIDYPALAAVNPGIVTMSLTGFGEGGPLSAKPGFDPILQAMSGMMTAQGGDGEPVFLTTAVNDVAAACLGAMGVCLALFHRARTGEGQAVTGSLAAFAAFMQSGELVRYPGRPPARRGGTDYPGPGALDRYYRTTDGWVRLQARADQVADLINAGWLPPEAGDLAEPDLKSLLDQAFATLGAADAVAQLAELSIPSAAAIRPVDLLANPAVQRSETFHEYPLLGGGSCFAPGRSAHFSRTQQDGVLVAPGLGQHSRELLREVGMAESDLESLIDQRIVVEQGPLEIPTLESYR